jgi:hypothetical protein
MGALLWLAFGLSIWIIGFALGVKSFDAFMITILIATIVATVHIARPFMLKVTGRAPDPDA